MNINPELIINGSIGMRVDIAIFTAQTEYLVAKNARGFSTAERWKDNLLISIDARQRLCTMLRDVDFMKQWEYIGYQRCSPSDQFLYFETIIRKIRTGT